MTGLLSMSRWSLACHTCTWFGMWATGSFPQVGSWCWNNDRICPDASCQALLCRKSHSWSWCVSRPQRFAGENGSHLQKPSPLDVLSGSCSGRFICHACGSSSSGSVEALVNRYTGRDIDTFLLVDLFDVGISGDTGIVTNHTCLPHVCNVVWRDVLRKTRGRGRM